MAKVREWIVRIRVQLTVFGTFFYIWVQNTIIKCRVLILLCKNEKNTVRNNIFDYFGCILHSQFCFEWPMVIIVVSTSRELKLRLSVFINSISYCFYASVSHRYRLMKTLCLCFMFLLPYNIYYLCYTILFVVI